MNGPGRDANLAPMYEKNDSSRGSPT